MKEFKQFLLRGNMIELAVAVVIGVAFGAVITALVADLITPLIAAIGGKPDFSSLMFTINNSTFRYGAFINSVLSFAIIAAVIFFLVIRPVNAMMSRRAGDATDDESKRQCPECLAEIPVQAHRCMFCAQVVDNQ